MPTAMRFIDRKRSRPVIPLVSLIDILTILLLFFVVAAEFRIDQQERAGTTERRLDINLPGVSNLEGAPIHDQRTTIAVRADGKILLDGSDVGEPEDLAAALRARLTQNPRAAFDLAPDEQVAVGRLIAVWDAITKAGIAVSDVPARVLKHK